MSGLVVALLLAVSMIAFGGAFYLLLLGVSEKGIVGLWNWLKDLINRAFRRLVHGRVAEDPLAGLDYAVRQVIERGGSDEDLIRCAENVAIKERMATQFAYGGPVTAMSVPHYSAAVTRVVYSRHPPCDDCEFETSVMFGGEVVHKIRVEACPAHWDPL